MDHQLKRLRFPALWALLFVTAAYLHQTRVPNKVEEGYRLLQALKTHDTSQVVALLSDEELTAIEVTRSQATQIVSELVMPEAEFLTGNVTKVTIAGNAVAFERPQGDQYYYSPPTIMMFRDEQRRPVISLSCLLASIWAVDKVDSIAGFRDPGWKERTVKAWHRVKELGMHRWMNWPLHVVEEMPREPLLGE